MNRKAHLLASISILPGLTGQFMAPPEGEEGTGGGAPPAGAQVEDLGGGAQRVTPSAEDVEAAEQHLPIPGSKEAEEAAAKAKEKEAPAERPEGLPEGFDTWEAYGKAQVEAGKKAAEAPKAETPEAKAAREAFDAKAAPFTKEHEETGTLTPESITKAAKEFGVTEDVVKQYLAGAVTSPEAHKVAVAEYRAPFAKEAGGEERLAAFEDWTRIEGNLTPSETAAINKALETMTSDAALEVAKPMIAKWKADGVANPPGTATRGAGAGGGGGGAGDVFGSMEEQTNAQRDPRYDRDPKYRREVDAKIGRSPDYE